MRGALYSYTTSEQNVGPCVYVCMYVRDRGERENQETVHIE